MIAMMDPVGRLINVCEYGDVNEAETLLNTGLAVDVSVVDGFTPLQIATANGHESVVRFLLMKGAALDKSNEFGWTPIMHAARYNQLNIISLLLQNNADLHAKNKLSASALNIAARAGHLPTVSLLVEAGIDLNGNGTHCENTALMSAAQYGHDAVVRYLVDRGCDVNYRNPNTGINALMLTALNGHLGSAQILIERGADANLTNANDRTALDIAIARGQKEVRAYLDRKTTKRPYVEPEEIKSDIIEAAKMGNITRMREVLDQDPSQRDATSAEDGATPLMFAAMNGRLDMAQILVERQCDVNKRDHVSGWTALMQATFHGKKNVAIYLVNAGADVSLQANNGCTAFEMASLIDDIDTELLRLLAAKRVGKSDKSKRLWSKNNTNGAIVHDSLDEAPKGSLKLWWKRTSNRFRNLKLGRTFMFSTGRLSAIDDAGTFVLEKGTERSKMMGSTLSMIDINRSCNSITSSISAYETMLLTENPRQAAYTLGAHPQNPLIGTDTLKPVIPPFLPPPTFEIMDSYQRKTTPRKPYKTRFNASDEDDRGSDNMVKSTHKRSVKLFSTAYNTSPNNSQSGSNTSPGSSGGASGLHTVQRSNKFPQSLYTDSKYELRTGLNKERTVAEESGNNLRHTLTMATANQRSLSDLHVSRASLSSLPEATSPSGSVDGRSGGVHRIASRATSISSTVSSGSTLTLSPSPVSKSAGDVDEDEIGLNSSTRVATHKKLQTTSNDELRKMLKEWSLEKFQSIFEEQEVDMEAFLTLTDADLLELGITRDDARQRILTAIQRITPDSPLS